MKDFASNFWAWVKETFTPHYRNEIEEYLNEAISQDDLERRMKILRRKGMI